MRIIWGILFGCLATTAQAQGLFSLNSREDGRMWEAVGRLELAGEAFCTGALIDERLVLTAAHCIFDTTTGEPVPVEDLNFLAGWRNGRASAYRRVKRAVAHPDYDFLGPADSDRVRNDIALLELQLPIRNTTIRPFETDTRPELGDSVGVVSYRHDRSEAPNLQETCEVISRQDGILVLSCEVDFGASGSPVFSFADDGRPRIVSVVSAKATADGTPVSLGTALLEPLNEVRALLETAENPGAGLERLDAGTRRDTGAKFVKP
ncbi:trypsin-like serine peptidase [Thetidibacter halocola]|uniref:Serine protease n=1 Tax=Thetidibacter halocola TaxID=2827239 RepID=A0A8J8B9P4_9RHOB|nr:trypsin-like serine protease [Thetidibacter halocola]MBS0125760.1 trypsin-like serine protease [Thetidibacter halocola]